MLYKADDDDDDDDGDIPMGRRWLSTSYNKDFTFKKLRTLEFDTSQCLIINKFRRQKTLHYIRLLNTY